MRGFKSFASATTFDFEPGVTAVVGPNGSGKSNVVDALAWVMGEQGAKTLRGGKMEDVIFAGTAGRPPLGRAHVALTIDNVDGALPIDYTEVTISRTLFRSGGSEYAINGTSCRLLDIQELLSDSGLGKEMHVIVGQGQLDKVLHATAEDRRGFIEEAAGILKHRRRKEKTLRKLDAMSANLARLGDLSTEIRRQLTPLGKQAAVARRAQTVQFDVRDAKARLLADEIVTLNSTILEEEAAEEALRLRRQHTEAALTAARAEQVELEQTSAAAIPQLNAARDTWYKLSSNRDAYKSLGVLAAERQKFLGSTEVVNDPSRDPDRLMEQAIAMREEEGEQELALEEKRISLETAMEIKEDIEAAVNAEDKRVRAQLRAIADRREGLARLAGKVAAAQSRVEAAEAEIGRLHASQNHGKDRHAEAASEFAALESQVAGVEAGEERLDAEYEQAAVALEQSQELIASLADRLAASDREKATLTARAEALALSLVRQDGESQIQSADLPGVKGPLAAMMHIDQGYETAIAAALGTAAESLVVEGISPALQAVEFLKNNDAGKATLSIIPNSDFLPSAEAKVSSLDLSTVIKRIDGSSIAREKVSAPPELGPTVDALLEGIVVVKNSKNAAALANEFPAVVFVTLDGELFSAWKVLGGSAGAPSLLELQKAYQEAKEKLLAVTALNEATRFELAGAKSASEPLIAAEATALAALNESDARLAAVAERLGSLGATLRSAAGESERHELALHVAQNNLENEQKALQEVTERFALAQETASDIEPTTEERDSLAQQASAARAVELDARLALRSAEELLAGTKNRAAALERAAATERTARQEAARKAQKRRYQASKAASIEQAVATLLPLIDSSIASAAAERDQAEALRAQREVELMKVRSATLELDKELAKLTDSVHKDELARAAQRLRIEALENKSIEELSFSVDHLLAEYGPQVLVPVSPAEPQDKWAELHVQVDENGAELPVGKPFVREEQEKRLKRAERDLAALGKVNPLALEEFAALEERHKFLSTQLEDLKASRKDLLDIIKEVDQRVEQVFSSAFADTAVQFERVFGRLFPGGEGRLILTDPDDMLTTGIEVEARPAGKKIKRLSLLSGGERSLTAVALLVAIFKARPSPFYVMDEVEAALDDTNLGRLITIFEELRESSQLIIITHQKRTMEVADALYGVSMRGDGVSTVISARIDHSEKLGELP